MSIDKIINDIKDNAYIIMYGNDSSEFGMTVSDIIKIIKSEAKGKWIDVNGDGSLFECSECGEQCCCDGKYCMGCGSEMENGYR